MYHHNPNIGAGIDYGMGTTNIDKDTGLRFGVISANEVGQAWYDESEPDYGNPSCPDCGSEDVTDEITIEKEDITDVHGDYRCKACGEVFWSDAAFGDDPIAHNYDGDGYQITQDGGDLFVIKSPYFTFCKFCSPCAPGAGYLLEPTPYGIKTYCLGHDWFEGNKAPYPVYSVETGGVAEPS